MNRLKIFLEIILFFAILFGAYPLKAWAIEPTQKVFSQLTPSSNFRRWADWYPVDFGQPEGFRVINHWDSVDNPNPWMHGHSSLNVPDLFSTLPSLYTNNPVNYFFLWQCRGKIGEAIDPNCFDQTLYREIISQGSAVDPIGKTTLEHWARGSSSNWEVYYDPSVIGFNNCDGNNIKQAVVDLNRPDIKKPWTIKLPLNPDTYYVSEPICVLVFDGYEQDKDKVIDSRYSSATPDFDTGNWISVTITHDVFKDNLGFDIVRAENIYLTDNSASSSRFNQKYCNTINTSDSFHCINENGQRVGLVINRGDKSYRAFAFEEYWMRKTLADGRYDDVIDKYGFGSFHYWSMSENEWDQVRNDGSFDAGNGSENQIWALERCDLDQWNNIIQCSPVPILTPTPSPTPLPGDLNHDGKVDILDLRQLLANFTNIFDYNLVVGNFGK